MELSVPRLQAEQQRNIHLHRVREYTLSPTFRTHSSPGQSMVGDTDLHLRLSSKSRICASRMARSMQRALRT